MRARETDPIPAALAFPPQRRAKKQAQQGPWGAGRCVCLRWPVSPALEEPVPTARHREGLTVDTEGGG